MITYLRWLAAAFGRLCVETVFANIAEAELHGQPPSGGCVLKPQKLGKDWFLNGSRLRAAVC